MQKSEVNALAGRISNGYCCEACREAPVAEEALYFDIVVIYSRPAGCRVGSPIGLKTEKVKRGDEPEGFLRFLVLCY